MNIGIGELAGLITAASWAGSCQVHTLVSRSIGALALTTVRVPLIIVPLAFVVLFSGASTAMPEGALVFLALSALMGVVICDNIFYMSCVLIGPRLALLIQSLSASMSALLGFIFLGEVIGPMGLSGILVTYAGVAFVIIEGGLRGGGNLDNTTPVQRMIGLGLAFGAALGMAASFLFLRQALLLGVDPFWAAFLRMTIGGLLIWGISIGRRSFVSAMKKAWKNAYLVKLLLVGAVISLAGNVLASVAMKYTETGIAATLIGLQPIFIIPIVALVEKKIPSARAIIGTMIAFSGTVMLVLR